MHKGFRLAVFLSTLLFSAAHATDLAQIKHLMAAHKTQEAYQMASQMAPQEEGSVDFDLLLASAAIDAHHPDVAVFALDRALIKQPGNPYTEEKLGEAYYLIGDYSCAKRLLKTVIASPAPQALRNDAKKMLEQAKNPPKNNAQAKNSLFSFEVASGYDSNINSATVSSPISFPNGPTIDLSKNSLAVHDEMADLRGDWQGYYPLPANREAGLFWDVNDAYRDNLHNRAFNLNVINTTAGFMLQKGDYTLRAPLRAQLMHLDGKALRRAFAMAMNVSRPINEHHAGMLFIEKGRQTYPRQTLLNTATNLAGAGWLYLPDNKIQTVSRVYYGINEATLSSSAAKAQSSHYYGGQISLSRELFNKGIASIDIGEQFGTFNTIDPAFSILRKDNFFNLGLTYQWKYSQNITVIGNYTHYQNNSNLPLFQYSRNIAELNLKYSL